MTESEPAAAESEAAAAKPELTTIRPAWRTILAVALALLVAGIALGQLQALLQGMHGSGRPSKSIGSLNHLFWSPDATKTFGAVGVWKEYADSTRDQPTAGPYEVAWWAVAVDALVFAPVYALALGLSFLRAKRQIALWCKEGTPKEVKQRLPSAETVNEQTVLRRYLRLAYAGIALAILALIADEVENVVNICLVHEGWIAGPDMISDRFRSLTHVLWFAGWAKWLLAGAAVLDAVVLGWIITAEQAKLIRPRWATLHPRLHLLRLQVALVVAAVALPFVAEQLVDMIRRWTIGQLAGTLALAWLFAVATWLVGSRLLVGGIWQPTWRRPIWARRILFGTVIGLAAAQATAHFFLPVEHKAGWGLLVPAAALAVLALLGWILPGSSPTDHAPTAQPALSADDNRPGLPRALAAIAIVGIGLAIVHASFGYSVYERAWTWRPSALIALALVAAFALLAKALARRPVVGGSPARRLVQGLLREPLVGMGVGSLLGLAVLQLSRDGGETPPEVLVGAGVLLVVGGWASYDTLGGDVMPKAGTALLRTVLGLLAAVLAVAYAAVIAWPFLLGERVGGVGILLFFLVVLACVGGLLVWVAPAIPVPLALSVMGLKRFPIVALLVFWFLAASHFDPGGYHNIRLKDASARAQGVTLTTAWNCWLGKNGLDDKSPCKTDDAPTPETGSATPLVFVATTGGGIRAAYWTDLVLDCAFEVEVDASCPDGAHVSDFTRSDRLFALSGISGGSVGLAEYAAYLSQKGPDAAGAEPGWVKSRLGVDALSGSGAWWLMVELPRAFLRFHSPTDRAGILERGWERQWPGGELGQGLLESSLTAHMPLLVLNGTSVEDGCRFATSPLDANVETGDGIPPGCRSTEPFDPGVSRGVSADSTLPATRDLVDFLCDDKKDVALSTAGLLSGRFPFVNPAGRLEGRCAPADTKAPVAYVVDGGYLDTSGTSPVLELMSGLQPLLNDLNRRNRNRGRCVTPVLIQIDNGFDAGAPRSSRPGELLVPLKTLFATRIGRAAEARVGGALNFRGGTSARWAHFVNVAHPGPKAPLGWTQSRASERELTAQLTQGKNERAFDVVKSWLSGGLACPTAP